MVFIAKQEVDERVLSPDPFDDGNEEDFEIESGTSKDSEKEQDDVASSDDSFDRFCSTTSRIDTANRRRSDAMQITVQDVNSVTVLTNDNEPSSSEKTIIQIESGSENDQSFETANEYNYDIRNDALSNLLKSFRENPEPIECQPSTSKQDDIFEEYEDAQCFNSIDQSPPRKRRNVEELECLPSTSSGKHSNDEVLKQPQPPNLNYEINSYGDYMRLKINKLNFQVNTEKSKPFEKVSDILKGFSVFVNGFTEPPALVIRDLMLAHGGEYHCYYMHGRTSFVIATSISTAKVDRLRGSEIYIKADWITESIANGKPLPYRDFLIYEKGAAEKERISHFLTTSKNSGERAQENNFGFLDARNPDFIKNYYSRSRLHLISTLAQDMKDFVANLKTIGKLAEKKFDENELMELKSVSNQKLNGNIIFHIDLDCFFVSVAMRDRPDLIDKPVAIAHSKGTTSNSMSEIASCSYAARNCGLKNGMLVKYALQMCPRLILLPYQFDDYVAVSKTIYEIIASYTLEIRAVSCDEMYINTTSLCQKYLISNPCRLAEHIRKIIKSSTNCAASVGIGPTSFLARMATRQAKPDGVYWLEERMIYDYMKNEKIKDLPGIGYQMMDRLSSLFGDITTCGELQSKSKQEMIETFGSKNGMKIYNQCRGEDEDPKDFWQTQLRKSVSCDINYGIRFNKKEEAINLMKTIGTELERKLIDCKMSAGCVTLKLMIRAANAPVQTSKFMGHGHCDVFTKTSNFNCQTSKAEMITNEIIKLYQKIEPVVEDLRGVGVTCAKLTSKARIDTVNAVQEMFSRPKKVRKEVGGSNVIDDEHDDVDMRCQIGKEPVKAIAVTQSVRSVPKPQDLKAARHLNIPEILRISEAQLRKSTRKLNLNNKKFDKIENIKTQISKLCSEEPSTSSVNEVNTFFESLLNAGKLESLKQILQFFMETSSDSTKSNLKWFEASHIIMNKIIGDSRKLYEFPIDFSRQEKAIYVPAPKPKTEKKLKNVQHLIREFHVLDSTGINQNK